MARGQIEDIDNSDKIFEVGWYEIFTVDFPNDIPEADSELLLFLFEGRDEFAIGDLHSFCPDWVGIKFVLAEPFSDAGFAYSWISGKDNFEFVVLVVIVWVQTVDWSHIICSVTK